MADFIHSVTKDFGFCKAPETKLTLGALFYQTNPFTGMLICNLKKSVATCISAK